MIEDCQQGQDQQYSEMGGRERCSVNNRHQDDTIRHHDQRPKFPYSIDLTLMKRQLYQEDFCDPLNQCFRRSQRESFSKT